MYIYRLVDRCYMINMIVTLEYARNMITPVISKATPETVLHHLIAVQIFLCKVEPSAFHLIIKGEIAAPP